jgi:3'-phosphoadenosine 5'-phosphosulfate sulfotransferase (PAPS reductase)/FAD synthetase
MEETTEYRRMMLPSRQAMPLDMKIGLTKNRIRSWYEYWHGNVYVSFSGGKDSTVLLDLVRQDYPDVPAVFCDTGLEYPEIRDFVKTFNNVVWIKPKTGFKDVLEKYGYPVISKEVSRFIRDIKYSKSEKLRSKRLYGYKGIGGRTVTQGRLPFKWRFLLEAPFECSDQCCDVMKKRPFKKYENTTDRKPFVGNMVADSMLRKTIYMKQGCNAFNTTKPTSVPLAFWLEKDIWQYLKERDVPYCKIYDMGHHRTGCMFCMFGLQHEKEPNRFQLMAKSHPKQYKYCIETLGLGKILDYIGLKYKPTKTLFER